MQQRGGIVVNKRLPEASRAKDRSRISASREEDSYRMLPPMGLRKKTIGGYKNPYFKRISILKPHPYGIKITRGIE